MVWDFEKLNELCKNRSLPDSTVYQKALNWKKDLALFHSGQSNIVWDNLSDHQKIDFKSKEWLNAYFESEAHVIAAAQSMHSMADILGQIINQTLLEGYLNEYDVSLGKILCELNRRSFPVNLINKISNFKKSNEFRYIEAFVNTIKHRRILDTNYHLEYGINKRNDQGLLFREFNYRNNNFPETWVKDIVGSYRLKIYNCISDIGNSINSYLSN